MRSEDCSDFLILVSLDVENDLDFQVISLFMYLRGSGSVNVKSAVLHLGRESQKMATKIRHFGSPMAHNSIFQKKHLFFGQKKLDGS